MRSLAALQSTKAGRLLLEQEQVFDDPASFLRYLQPRPYSSGEARRTDALPVYTHQQVYLDYQPSVVAKIKALRAVAQKSAQVRPEFVWIDTDRAASDKLGLRLYLPTKHGSVAVRLAPSNCERLEPRFVRLDPTRLSQATRRMVQLIRQLPGEPKESIERLERLTPLLNGQGSLADLSRRLTNVLFAETMSFQPSPILVSDLVASGALNPMLRLFLSRQKEFVAVFNARIRELRSLDIDPKVKPLPDGYLPLFMPCPVDGRRLRLHLGRMGDDHFAWVKDSTGREHRFELGKSGSPSLDDLGQRVRWGPDVTLPILLGDRYSGMVAGRSSALYMLVFRDVMLKVMDVAPPPVLVPVEWDMPPACHDSLFVAYLRALTI